MISAYINKLDTKTLNNLKSYLGVLNQAISSFLVGLLCWISNVDAFAYYAIAFSFFVSSSYFIFKRNQFITPGSTPFTVVACLTHLCNIFIFILLLNSMSVSSVFIAIILILLLVISELKIFYADSLFKDTIKNLIDLKKIDDLAKEGKLQDSFLLTLDTEKTRTANLRRVFFLSVVPMMLWLFISVGTYIKTIIFFQPGVLNVMLLIFLFVFSSVLLSLTEKVNKILIKEKFLYGRGE